MTTAEDAEKSWVTAVTPIKLCALGAPCGERFLLCLNTQ